MWILGPSPIAHGRFTAPAIPGDALNMPTAVRSFNTRVRLSIMLGTPAIPM